MKMISRHQGWMLATAMGLGLVGVAGAQGYGPQYADPAAQNSYGDPNQPDPPQRVARISVIQGTASFEPASVNDFSPAEVNYPMTTGDRLYAAQGSSAEVQTGQIATRLGQNTDMTVTAMTDTLAQFGLASGSVRLREYGMEPGTTVELDTPNVAITVLTAGDIRVDVDPNDEVSYLTVHTGSVQVDGADFEQTYGPGSRVRLDGLNPLQVDGFAEQYADALDRFADGRDAQIEAGLERDQDYLNAGTVGGADLGSYGDWQQDADNGAVWFPRGVAADWEPYRVGHWAWIAPWGWTWVESEPWGFAPFHYGRWARFGSRWGWIPGSAVVRPVWAPALVVFVGGSDFSLSVGYREGVTGWFPLGPREVYQPWYHTSPRYLNRVNVSNIWDRDQRNVRRVYEQRTVDVRFTVGGDPRGGYAYRDHGTVMSQAAFAAGRGAAQNQVRVRPADFSRATVMPHPPVSPVREIVAPAPPRAVPPHRDRPVLDARDRAQGGQQGAGYGAPIQRQSPGAGYGGSGYGNGGYGGGFGNRDPRNGDDRGASSGSGKRNGADAGNGQGQPGNGSWGQGNSGYNNGQGGNRGGQNNPGNGQGGSNTGRGMNPGQGADQGGTGQGGNRGGSGNNPGGAASNGGDSTGNSGGSNGQNGQGYGGGNRGNGGGQSGKGGGQGSGNNGGGNPGAGRQGPPRTFEPAPQPVTPIHAPMQGDQNSYPNGGRSLFNRATPPAPRPGFDQQRQSVEQTEPGRPLSPQQLDNVRRHQPVGDPQQPIPQPRPQPQPQPVQAQPQPSPQIQPQLRHEFHPPSAPQPSQPQPQPRPQPQQPQQVQPSNATPGPHAPMNRDRDLQR